VEENAKNAFLVAREFVIHPQILNFLVSKIVRLLSVMIANEISRVTVLLLVYICDQFVVPKIRHSRRHCRD